MAPESQAVRELPRYKSHKEVWALKIGDLQRVGNGDLRIVPEDPEYAPFTVESKYVPKHEAAKPQVGWYYVVYKDGYRSFSPAGAFEEGYTRI